MNIARPLGALIAGAMLPLSFAPLGWWPVALLSVAALLGLLERAASARAALVLGWLFGLGMFGTGASWVYVSIHDYGSAPVALAAFLTLLFCAGLALFHALLGWGWWRWVRERSAAPGAGFAALWVLLEWIRGWILTGFPWLYLGDSQVDGPLAAWVPVIGVFGVSTIVACSGVALWRCLGLFLEQKNRSAEARPAGIPARLLRAVVPALVAWLLALPLAGIEWTTAEGPARPVALVQGNIPQLLKWDPQHLDNTMAIYASLSEPVWGTDIVVWPESAIPAYLDRVTDYLSAQATRSVGAGSALLLGIPSRDASVEPDGPPVIYNSVIALGAQSGMYHKRRLVPFGEYVPLEGLLRGLIAFFDLPMSGFARGPEDQPLLQAQGIAIGTFICYEIAYPDLVRTALPQAGLLLTVSNDTWFGASAGPLQHLAIARMRALENGRDLLRATNNGVSALIDARGQITARGGQFTREVIKGSVQPRSGLTPFAAFGSWPVILLCIVLVVRRGRGRVSG